MIEGTLASQVAMLDILAASGLAAERLVLIGGAAKSSAVQRVLTQMVDVPVVVPALDEYVTKGSAMQAACALTGAFPTWEVTTTELPRNPVEPRIAAQREAAMAALGYVEPALAAV